METETAVCLARLRVCMEQQGALKELLYKAYPPPTDVERKAIIAELVTLSDEIHYLVSDLMEEIVTAQQEGGGDFDRSTMVNAQYHRKDQ